ncbi:1079_t:CDS:1 [Ambispora gerdemannii]|uniref:1079_t:CDS:1 n=1 Tax=Ambispora gerdemannii TaxID=144530 RepID=A0A9N9A3J6_9GLOM|nr:1079_t:CDS:1 [Ambispora gerdemannii]
MTRGSSLTEDLKSILFSQEYSDIQIKCSDRKILLGCRILLAARCQEFNRMLYPYRYNGMRETNTPVISISFPEISSITMAIVLEYLYVGEVSNDKLNAKNSIDIFYAAKYLLLPTLENIVRNFVKNMLDSKKDAIDIQNQNVVDLFSSIIVKNGKKNLDKNNSLIKSIYKKMISIQISTIQFEIVSFDMLYVLLSQALDKDEYFATDEYDLFRYVVLWGANKISSEALATFSRLLPSSTSVDKFCEKDAFDELKFHSLRTSLLDKIGQLLPHINLELIPQNIIGLLIHPLEIFETERLLKAYQHHAISNSSRKKRCGQNSTPKHNWFNKT